MSVAHFSLMFRGPALENGDIDVQDVAPALLAAGELMQAANQVINGENAKVSVRVRATARGSFEVDLTLLQQLVDSVLSYAKARADGIAAADQLADLVLKVGGGVAAFGGGLLMLLKWLKGQKPGKIENDGGKIIIHIGEIRFETNPETLKLAEDINVRNSALRLISVLHRDGIESISVRQPDGEELTIEQGDVPSFEVPDTVEEELQDEEKTMLLQIISLSFKEDNKWRLTDGADPFTAGIDDMEFLNKIARDEISFGKNDYLLCRVRERQFSTIKGLRKERTIIEVLEHKPAARQLNLL